MLSSRTLLQKKEARKRNLQFHILTSVSLNPNLRLVKLDSSYIGLVEIHDEYCKSRGFGRDEPLLQWQEKLRAYYEVKGWDTTMKDEDIPIKEIQHVRLETKTEVETKYIPRTVLSNVSVIIAPLVFVFSYH
jgi:transformation/transcription domain-associated protein